MTPYLSAEEGWDHAVFGNLTPMASLAVQRHSPFWEGPERFNQVAAEFADRL